MTKERRNEPRMALNLQFLDAEAPERLVGSGP